MEAVHVKTITQKFACKEQAMAYFGFQKKSKRTFERYAEEFKLNPKFSSGYINPTGGMPLYEIDKFEDFLRWKDATKYLQEAIA